MSGKAIVEAGRRGHAGPPRVMSAQPVRDAIDRWQQARPLTAVPCAVAKKFTDDGASRLAALIAYWSFFSIFPLLLAFASILGFLLDGNPDFQQDVLDSTVAQIPVIGDQLSRDVTSLKGSGLALAIGIVGAVWAGLGVTLAIGRALDELWAVPRLDRPDYVHSRLRGLAILVVIGTANVLTTVVVTLARNGTIQPPVAGIAERSRGRSHADRRPRVTARRPRVTVRVAIHPRPGPARDRIADPLHDQLLLA